MCVCGGGQGGTCEAFALSSSWEPAGTAGAGAAAGRGTAPPDTGVLVLGAAGEMERVGLQVWTGMWQVVAKAPSLRLELSSHEKRDEDKSVPSAFKLYFG